MTLEEKQEIQQLIDAHERTIAVCRACAQTMDLAREIRRGGHPDSAALTHTIGESERVLAELGRVEIALAELKATLW
jgi:hypothetical protein